MENKVKTDEVKDAFEDLEALMLRAGEMVSRTLRSFHAELSIQRALGPFLLQVKIVQSLNAKLSTTSSSTRTESGPDPDAETRTFLRSSLVQLGLPVPAITQDAHAMQGEQEYLDALAGELGGLLTGAGAGEGLMMGREGKGLVGMDEAWVVWNRARGVCESSPLREPTYLAYLTSLQNHLPALISPSTMQKVVDLLPAHTRPRVTALRFLSGLEVLHTPVYAPANFARRIKRRLEGSVSVGSAEEASRTEPEPYTTTLEIALLEALSVSLTREMMAFITTMVPEAGLVRDDQGAGIKHDGVGVGPVEERWYRDLISGFVWTDGNGRSGR